MERARVTLIQAVIAYDVAQFALFVALGKPPQPALECLRPRLSVDPGQKTTPSDKDRKGEKKGEGKE